MADEQPLILIRKSELPQLLAENVDLVPAGDLKADDRTFDLSKIAEADYPLLALACVVRITEIKTPGMVVGAAEANGWHWIEVQYDAHGAPYSTMLKSTEIVPRLKEAAPAQPCDSTRREEA